MLQLLALFLELMSQYLYGYTALLRSILEPAGSCISASPYVKHRALWEQLLLKCVSVVGCRSRFWQGLLKALFMCLFSPFVDHSNGSFNLKALSGSSGYKFGVLAKIVNYMKVQWFHVKCLEMLSLFFSVIAERCWMFQTLRFLYCARARISRSWALTFKMLSVNKGPIILLHYWNPSYSRSA